MINQATDDLVSLGGFVTRIVIGLPDYVDRNRANASSRCPFTAKSDRGPRFSSAIRAPTPKAFAAALTCDTPGAGNPAVAGGSKAGSARLRAPSELSLDLSILEPAVTRLFPPSSEDCRNAIAAQMANYLSSHSGGGPPPRRFDHTVFRGRVM